MRKTKLKFKNFVFDCDSTLTTIEGLDQLAHLKGLNGRVSDVTKLAMEGAITFDEAFIHRINILKPHKTEVERLGSCYSNSPFSGASELIKKIKQNGGSVFILSGGLKKALNIFADYLGIEQENVYGIDLLFSTSGEYSEIIDNKLFQLGKAQILEDIAKKGSTVFVGDGANDLEAADKCDLFIGFGGVLERQVVKKRCEFYYTGNTLLDLWKYFV